MTRRAIGFAAAIALALAMSGTAVRSDTDGLDDGEDGPAAQPNPCAAPNEIGDSIEETAWRLWVAATCPVNDNQYPFVVWENWIEQSQLFPPDPTKGLKVPNAGATNGGHIVHESPLALAINPNLRDKVPGLLGAPDTNCNKAQTPPSNQPNLTICEEVRERRDRGLHRRHEFVEPVWPAA